MQIDIATFAGLGGIPVIVAAVFILKAYVTDPRAWPVLAVALGVAWCVGIRLVLGDPWQPAIVEGFVVGLMSSGAWSATKTFVGQ